MTSPLGPSAADRYDRYEADSNGNVYVHEEDVSVWPTGIRVTAWASRNDIRQDEFDRHLRMLDERDRDAR